VFHENFTVALEKKVFYRCCRQVGNRECQDTRGCLVRNELILITGLGTLPAAGTNELILITFVLRCTSPNSTCVPSIEER
jgi:hypothetical protein